MIRRATLSLNEATGKKHEAIDNLIVMYLYFLQKVINALWNHEIFFGKFVPKQWYKDIKTPLTERYKQCAAKQALAVVKSPRKGKRKTKPVIHNASLELERLKNVKKGRGKKARRGKKFSRHVNRLLSHWAYHHARARLSMLCEENRVQLVEVKVDADYNAACNIRDRWIAQGEYGPLSENHLTIPSG